MNDLAIADDDAPLAPGQMRLYCAAEPPLQAGGYWLQALQTVDGLKSQPDNNRFGVQNPFVVSGPRFRLPPQDLQCVYPPAYMTGQYEEVLAHAVLRTRTLPWVRSIDGGTAGAGDDAGTVPPWLALLMLYPDELGDARPKTITVAQLIDPGNPAILPPDLPDAGQLTADELASQLLAIDLDLAAFRAISPTLAELPLLAHVREVNTDRKEIMGMVDDGWFSVVVGNRLPLSGADNSCFLVSLEGHQDHLHGSAPPSSQYTRIRLVSLASWTFTAAAARGSFLSYMQNLCQRGGIDLLQPTHRPFAARPDAAQAQAREALDIGYLPLRNTTRSGEATTSWYRGPLSPVPTAPDPLGPYFYSDRAIRYDQANGLFNMAYASAWQIGQLLALSDAAFAQALFQWRIGSYQGVQAGVASRHLQALSRWPVPPAPDAAASGPGPGPGPGGALLHLLGNASRAVANSAAMPRVQAHHLRDSDQLPGVLEELDQQIAAGADPLYLLQQHVRQAGRG